MTCMMYACMYPMYSKYIRAIIIIILDETETNYSKPAKISTLYLWQCEWKVLLQQALPLTSRSIAHGPCFPTATRRLSDAK